VPVLKKKQKNKNKNKNKKTKKTFKSTYLILIYILTLHTILPGVKYNKKSTVSHQYNGTSCDL